MVGFWCRVSDFGVVLLRGVRSCRFQTNLLLSFMTSCTTLLTTAETADRVCSLLTRLPTASSAQQATGTLMALQAHSACNVSLRCNFRDSRFGFMVRDRASTRRPLVAFADGRAPHPSIPKWVTCHTEQDKIDLVCPFPPRQTPASLRSLRLRICAPCVQALYQVCAGMCEATGAKSSAEKPVVSSVESMGRWTRELTDLTLCYARVALILDEGIDIMQANLAIIRSYFTSLPGGGESPFPPCPFLTFSLSHLCLVSCVQRGPSTGCCRTSNCCSANWWI